MTPAEQMSRAQMRASLLAFSIRASTADVARICELALRLSPPEPQEQRIEGVHLDGVSADTVRKVLAGLLEEMGEETPVEAPPPADHVASPTERPT